MNTDVSDTGLARSLTFSFPWDDVRVMLDGLDLGPGADVLTLASSGDYVGALLTSGVHSVTAVDISFPQLALTELKLAAAELDYEEYVVFTLGRSSADETPKQLYADIRGALHPGTKRYWDAQRDRLVGGACRTGTMQKWAARFRRYIRPAIWPGRDFRALFETEDLDEQRRLFEETFGARRWSLLVRLVTTKSAMRMVASDPVQYRQIVGDNTDLRDRLRRLFTKRRLLDNPYMQWLFLGNLLEPHKSFPQLSRSGHRTIRERRDRVQLVHDDVDDFLERAKPRDFSAFNYSNAFDYIPAEKEASILRKTVGAARPGARCLWWDFMTRRSTPADSDSHFTRRRSVEESLLERNRIPVYGGLHIVEAEPRRHFNTSIPAYVDSDSSSERRT